MFYSSHTLRTPRNQLMYCGDNITCNTVEDRLLPRFKFNRREEVALQNQILMGTLPVFWSTHNHTKSPSESSL